MVFKDLSNKKIGRLLVISVTSRKPIHWLCKCDCGRTVILMGAALQVQRSCGCLKREVTIKRNFKHGHAQLKTKTYLCWTNMKSRCCNINNNHYLNYGGRGIKVCRRWIYSFSNFLKDMGLQPIGLQLDRKGNNGNYCRSNCRWATCTQNARNKRNSSSITIKGKSRTIPEWSEITGLKPATIRSRLKEYKWSNQDCINQKLFNRSEVPVGLKRFRKAGLK